MEERPSLADVLNRVRGERQITEIHHEMGKLGINRDYTTLVRWFNGSRIPALADFEVLCRVMEMSPREIAEAVSAAGPDLEAA